MIYMYKSVSLMYAQLQTDLLHVDVALAVPSALLFYVEKLCWEHEILKILNFHLQLTVK